MDFQYVLARIREQESSDKKCVATLKVGAFKMVIPIERLRNGKYRSRKVDMTGIGKLP